MRQCRKHLQRQVNPFDLAKLGEEKGKLEEQMGAEGFWEDVENANKVNQRMKVVSAKLEKYDKLARRADDLETLIEMADEENDESLLEEIGAEYDALTEAVEALKLETLLKGPYDAQNAVLSLHAGAGGTEAQDWTLRTGYPCFTACTPAIVKSTALP